MIEHGVSFNTLKNIDLLNKFLLDNPNIIQQFEEFKRDYCE